MRNIRQNLVFAFLYNALGIPVAAGVLYPFFGWLLSPIIAGAAMSRELRLRHQQRPAPAKDTYLVSPEPEVTRRPPVTKELAMMNQNGGWMYGWSGGGMWMWPIAILIVVLLVVLIARRSRK